MANAELLMAAVGLMLAGAVVSRAAEFKVECDAPKEARLGATVKLVVKVTNLGKEAVVKEPLFDSRSIDFMVSFAGGRPSRYTKYHPRAGQPSTLQGQDLGKGKSISLSHEVVALKAGDWTVQPIFRGAAGDPVEGEKKTVRVLAEQDGAAEMLVNFDTQAGTIKARFWPEVAPATALHIAELVRSGYYDGLKFHRTIKGFMIQGGCPQGTGAGSPGYSIEAEFNQRQHVAGVFSMARGGDPYESQGKPPRPEFMNSAGSQFFLCDAAAPHLDGAYTAFGEVVEGLDVVHAIAAAPVEAAPNGKMEQPVKPVIMKKVTLVPAGM